jgi:hypothetical protein
VKSIACFFSVLCVFVGLPAIAAEAPEPTFSIWGEPASVQINHYNLIKNLHGQEFVGYTVNCLDGDSGVNDTFVFRVQVFNAATGALSYEITPSIDSPNNIPGQPECAFGSLGLGVAVSGQKRVIVFGMTETNNALIYGYNAETGAQLYKVSFPRVDGEYTLATAENTGEWSAVGNYLNNRSDQLRVTYFKGMISPGPVEIKVVYYDVLTGNQVSRPIVMTVPTPALP